MPNSICISIANALGAPRLRLGIFLAVSLILMSIGWFREPHFGPDSVAYQIWADGLIAHNFNYAAFYKNTEFFTPVYFYTITITLVAVCKTLFGEHWAGAFIFINLCTIPACIYLSQKIARICGVRLWLIALMPLLFLISRAYLSWPKGVISDPVYAMLVLAGVYQAIAGNWRSGSKAVILFLLTIALIFLGRPASPPVIIMLLALFFLPGWLETRLSVRLLPVYLLIGIMAVFAVYVQFIQANIDGIYEISSMERFIRGYQDGMVIHDRPETWVSFGDSTFAFWKLSLLRVAYFFVPFIAAFSVPHTALCIAFFLPVYGALIAGESSNVLGKTANPKAQRARLVLITFCLGVATYHSALLIDYGWRYRYPIIAPLIVLAFLYADGLITRFSKAKD